MLLTQAKSIGFISDRTSLTQESLCSGFLIGDKMAASVASILAPYVGTPSALRFSLPRSKMEYGVKAIHLHRRYDRRLAMQTIETGTLPNSPEAALQHFNCCILQLEEEVQFFNEKEVEQVSKALRFPLDISEEGFRGSLSDIELPLVLQTLNNARKQGILYICDELLRPIAQIFCSEGKIVSAKYYNLLNEMAIYQIVQKKLLGKFAFHPCRRPSWLPANSINQSTDALLIEAHRRLDELESIRGRMMPGLAFFARADKFCRMEYVPDDIRRYAERLWHVLDATIPALNLWLLVGADDFTVFRCLFELFRSGQIVRIQESGTIEMETAPKSKDETVEVHPLALANKTQLNPQDPLVSLSIDLTSDRANVKTGSLLGAIEAYDSYHLLHDIPLMPISSGTPIFKNDEVIGMHCGAVPTYAALYNSSIMLQQMLWIDAIVQLQNDVTAAVTAVPSAEVQPVADDGADSFSLPGCREVASISCPSCGKKTFKTARLCSSCGFEFVPHLGKKPGTLTLQKVVPAVAVLILLLCVTAGVAFSGLPEPIYEGQNVTVLPHDPWLDVKILQLEGKTGNWFVHEGKTNFKNGDTIRVHIDVKKPCFLYAIYKGSSQASIVYPSAGFSNNQTSGSSVTFPEGVSKVTGGEILNGLSFAGAPGVDNILLVASKPQLTCFNDAGSIDTAYLNAQHALDVADNPAGVLISENDFTGAHNPGVSSEKNIFIKEIHAVHD